MAINSPLLILPADGAKGQDTNLVVCSGWWFQGGEGEELCIWRVMSDICSGRAKISKPQLKSQFSEHYEASS